MNVNANLLANRLWPIATRNEWLRPAVLAVVGSLLVALCAQAKIPLEPVPMTLQTLAVLAIGGAYGARLGAATLCLYALEGAVGLPVFANFQAGIYLPTGEIMSSGGYIIGFILAAGLVGWLAERGWDKSAVSMLLAMILGAAVLYIPGLIWLAVWFSEVKGMTAGAAVDASFVFGCKPFILGDLVKAALAVTVFPAAWPTVPSK